MLMNVPQRPSTRLWVHRQFPYSRNKVYCALFQASSISPVCSWWFSRLCRYWKLIRIYEPSLAPAHTNFLRSVTSCTIHFADAMERSVKGVQRGSTTLKSALSSENMRTLQQFMQADPYPRTFTHGTWANARHDMEIVIDLPFVCIHSLSTFFRSSMTSGSLCLRVPESD